MRSQYDVMFRLTTNLKRTSTKLRRNHAISDNNFDFILGIWLNYTKLYVFDYDLFVMEINKVYICKNN